ncbi:MAG: hypothetical protein IT372_13625 [Polyangiaceae bacterium]|nr:hypothetical protein [Polyangiaceae bacterium]
MRRRLLVALVPAAPLLLAYPLACSTEAARIGLVMRTPEGLLDAATSVELAVFPAGQARCDASGHVSAIPDGEDTQRFYLESSGCPAGVRWCKDIELDKDGTDKMFSVIARNAAGTLAEGCTVATIDQDPLEVTIKVQRYNPPPCCNDGALQAGEQCDFGGVAATTCSGEPGGECLGITADDVCDCDCRSKEILLSIDDDSDPFLANGPPGSKGQLAMIFAPGSAKLANALRAVFHSTNPDDANGGEDINIRFLSQDLHRITDPYPLSQQLRLPLSCADVTVGGLTRFQQSPSIAQIDTDLTGVVYASQQPSAGVFDIWLVVHGADGCKEVCALNDTACLAADTPVRLTTTSGAADPDIAGGPPHASLTVWTRDGRVFGRTRTSAGELNPAAEELPIADNGTHPRVAGTSGSWLVVYQGSGEGDPDGIYRATVTTTGGVTTPVRVNTKTDGLQEQPDVAMLPDGKAIVVWRSDTDIFFQRFDAAGNAVAGDQDAPLNTTTEGEQANPAVASAGNLGDFFAVAWEHSATGEIFARLVVGAEGFSYNSVTGQNDDFAASHPGVPGQRRLPAVAVGGAGYVAIGWQDDSQNHPGVYVRRFPLPPAF